MTDASTVDGTVEFKPAEPDYQPVYSMEEQLRLDSRPQDAALAPGTVITLIDNGHDRWHEMVLPGTANLLTLQLQVSEDVIWWKRVEVFAYIFGSWYNIRRLGTSDDRKTATVDLTATDAQSGTLKLEFWRAGFLNSGYYLASMLIDVPSNLGNKLVFLCDRPSDR